jgi:phosphoribosylamine--glycine ligase
MMRLKSDLAELCIAALDGRLDEVTAEWDPRAALGVVMAAGGYPGSYEKGHTIEGLALADSDITKVFHAGTSMDDDRVITSGGRVLCVTALGDDVTRAQASAYEAVSKIHWDGVYFRTDIGYRAVLREDR